MTYILYNPLANSGSGTDGLGAVMASFAAEEPTLRDVTQLELAAFFADKTAEDKVILCGGDGTIHRVVNALEGAIPASPIHVWRFGTGNDFLRDVTPEGAPAAQSVVLNDYLTNLPRAGFGGQTRLFLNGCSAGVDSLVCWKMEQHRLLKTKKKANYAATAMGAFFKEYKPVSARITVDGETRSYDGVWMAGAMNGRFQGGGMRFAPEQDRRSDLVCAYVWHGTSPLGTLLHFPTVMDGSYTRFTKYCELRFGREITVELDAPLYLQLDGEVVPDVTRFTIRK